MKLRAVVHILFAALLVSLAGCATLESAGHKYIMRGQILELEGDAAYLCIGSKDGAKAGQELEVYRFVRVPSPYAKSVQPYYRREPAGKIKIMEVVDEHYARAKVLAGDVRANYVAELDH